MFTHLINIFPQLCLWFPTCSTKIIYFAMGLVQMYHAFSDHIVFNLSFDEAVHLETIANHLLTPVHYICGGKRAIYDRDHRQYQLTHRFDYWTSKKWRVPLAMFFFPQSLLLGGALKWIALSFPTVRERHHQLQKQIRATAVRSLIPYYRSLGMNINDFKKGERLLPQGEKRKSEDIDHLSDDKELLDILITLFHRHGVPCWVESGTLLGAYRYGGVIPWDHDVDISVLVHDFDNVRHLLNQLDSKKYAVQDWSERTYPKSYIRVYIKKTHSHLDIYHHQIDPASQTLMMISPYVDSEWMGDSWKKKQGHGIFPIPYGLIFPLKKGNFDGIEVPVPNDTQTYLRNFYVDLRASKKYNPKTGNYEKDLANPYWKFSPAR